MLKKMAVILLVASLIPLQSFATAEQDTHSYSQRHIFITEERNFNGSPESIYDASEKVSALYSANVEFSTEFKTSSSAYQSLFFVGSNSNDFGYAANHYIALYMNSGTRIGVEMKGIKGGYVHFHIDLPRFDDNEWHTVSLKMVDGTRTRIIFDGIEYEPIFADNSVGMPDEKSTKFVPDADFDAELLHFGGARRADRYDWLFNGLMRNTSFTTDAYEDGTPAPNLVYDNLDFTGETNGKDITEHLGYIQTLKKGTLSFRLRRAEADDDAVQSLITVSNTGSSTSFSSVYIRGNRIGFEFNNGTSPVASGEQAVEAFKNNTNWYTITITFDGAHATAYVDDKKAFTLPSEVFLNATEDADNIMIGANGSRMGECNFKGYMDRFRLYNTVLSEDDIIHTLNRSTVAQRIEYETVERPLPAREDAYRSEDFKMFASISPDMVLNENLVGDPDMMGEDGFGFRIPALLRAVTPDKKDNDVLIAFADKGNDSADWGNVDVANRRSFNNGKTWSNVDTIMSLAPRDAPQDFHDWGSAFYIDPVPVQADSGDIVMMVDMWPESKGLHAASWLENGSGYETIDGKDYLVLYDGDSKVGDGQMTDLGNAYTVRENGWIYDSNNQKTNYYIPQNHSADIHYETMGDMYYAVGEPDYITETPPLVPEDPEGRPEGSNDIYVGNIYLSYNKPDFDPDNPVFVKKRQVGPDKEGAAYSKYPDYETDPAPLRATVTSYLWVTRSSDYGETWSQPVDITPQVKQSSDGAFLGVGPGTGIVLKNQEKDEKNGRIIIPAYALGRATALYSDDEGVTWERATSSSAGYINNIDEVQFIELSDGTIVSFGRQQGKGKTPVSISKDGGETWGEMTYNDLISVQVQKSFITYPLDSDTEADETSDERFDYVPGMQKGKQYVIAAHATGNPNDASRTNGVVKLGEVLDDDSVLWIAERSLKLKPNPYANTQGRENFFAYSSLAVLENGNIGILFEPQPNNYIAYAEFNLEWILNGEQEGIIYEPNMTLEHVIDVDQPALSDLSLTVEKGSNTLSHIAPGDTLTFTTSMSENVFVIGQPTLSFDMDGKQFTAVYSGGSGSNEITFSYQVKEGDIEGEEPVVTVLPNIHVPESALVEGFKNDRVLYRISTKIQLYPDNRTALEQLIAHADEITDRGQYTEETWDAFIRSRENAKSVLDDQRSTVFVIQEALDELRKAMDNLEVIFSNSAAEMKALVEKYEEEGEFANDEASRSLKVHLTAVVRYENKEAGEKVVKHMENFKWLLDYQKDQALISDKAYQTLNEDADKLILKWR